MLRARCQRLTTFVLLSAYLAVNTVNGLFHDHASHSHVSHGHESHEHCLATAWHEHGAADDEHHEPSGDESPGLSGRDVAHPALHDEDCAVCHFVGQPTIHGDSPAPTVSTTSVELSVEHTSQTCVASARTVHSRAPPALG
ncbi:MAG TPA: hypothetical protein VHV08_14920 [Pirellulales bacterium]|nr:hypothetical protein [Pirellulales bacterium]